MKNINIFISEKLKITATTKIKSNNTVLEPKDFDSCENIGIDNKGNKVLVIGKPFKDFNDKNWELSMDFLQKNEFEIIGSYSDIEDKEKHKYYVYVCIDDTMNLYCYPYDKTGILVYEK